MTSAPVAERVRADTPVDDVDPGPVLRSLTLPEGLVLLMVLVFAELLSLGWIASALRVEAGGGTWEQVFVLAGLDLLALLPVPLLVFAALDAWPLGGVLHRRHVAVRALALLGIAAAQNWLSGAIYGRAFERIGIVRSSAQLFGNDWVEQFVWSSAIVGCASLAYHVLRQQRQARALARLNAQLRTLAVEAQLSALTAELRPHFLFNTLNGLAELVHVDAARAEQMLVRLGSLLRATLAAGETPTVPLANELRHVDDYLALQQLRFGDRLAIRREVAHETLAQPVPTMLLQPLVENALVHGVEARAGARAVIVRAERTGDALVLSVLDDGPGPGQSRTSHGTGMGMRNVRERLAALHGARAGVELLPADGGGACARVTLPWSHAEPAR